MNNTKHIKNYENCIGYIFNKEYNNDIKKDSNLNELIGVTEWANERLLKLLQSLQ